MLRSNKLCNPKPTETPEEFEIQDDDKDDDSDDSDPELSISGTIPKKKKKKATDESSATKFLKYLLGKVVEGPTIIILMPDTSYFLGKLLTKGTSIAILNQSIKQYGEDLEECNNNIFYVSSPNPLSKLYQGKYRDIDFSTNTLQDDDQDSISVSSFYPLTKTKRKMLLDNEKARITDEMVNQPVQHRVGIITKGKKNYNILSQRQVLNILTNILCLLFQKSGVKIKDGHIDPTNMGSLALLTMEIVKMLGKKSIKDWFNSMKINYLFSHHQHN